MIEMVNIFDNIIFSLYKYILFTFCCIQVFGSVASPGPALLVLNHERSISMRRRVASRSSWRCAA